MNLWEKEVLVYHRYSVMVYTLNEIDDILSKCIDDEEMYIVKNSSPTNNLFVERIPVRNREEFERFFDTL